MTRRKSPVRHRVREHKRSESAVVSHKRGSRSVRKVRVKPRDTRPRVTKVSSSPLPIYLADSVDRRYIEFTENVLKKIPKKHMRIGRGGASKVVLLPADERSEEMNFGAIYSMAGVSGSYWKEKYVGLRGTSKSMLIFVPERRRDSWMEGAILHEWGHFVWFVLLSRSRLSAWNNTTTGEFYSSSSEDFAEAYSRYLRGEHLPKSYETYFKKKMRM